MSLVTPWPNAGLISLNRGSFRRSVPGSIKDAAIVTGHDKVDGLIGALSMLNGVLSVPVVLSMPVLSMPVVLAMPFLGLASCKVRVYENVR